MRDLEFRVGLLAEAIECVLNDEIDVAEVLLQDYVNATVGFEELGVCIMICTPNPFEKI